MTILGLHYAIWLVLIVYFAGMLLLGWWSKRRAGDSEGYLLGNRRFGTAMMTMHAFGAGTNPGDAAGTISGTVAGGASGIWVSWMWMFGTPFYWLIAPLVRRMRYLTLADFFRERFGPRAAVLYTVVAGVGMTIFFGGVLLATTRTVQGMMGPAAMPADRQAVDWWFFGILLVTTAVFVVYGYWGGIVAAIRTDMVQGLMIIALSFLAIPAALGLKEVGGLGGARGTLSEAAARVNEALPKALAQHEAGDTRGMVATLTAIQPYDAGGAARKALDRLNAGQPAEAAAVLRAAKPADYLSLFHPVNFSLAAVILLCINAPLSALALPHLMSVTSAGKTEWEGRMGFTGGNVLKRVCTIGWSVLGLAWLAHLMRTGSAIHPDAAFGDAVQQLFSPVLQGVMLACVMAASMSSGDAVQVTVAGLFTQSLYRQYLNPSADERQLVRFTRIAGVLVILLSLAFAILMRNNLVKSILDYFNILSLVGISTAMGLLWRRMNQPGVFASTFAAAAVFIVTRYVLKMPREVTIGLPILTGLAAGVIVSLLTAPPEPGRIERFFKRIYVPIGQEDKLDLPLDQAVPASKRLLTAGGLFLVRPSRQSWVGFLVTLAIVLGCVAAMLAILGV